MPKLTLHIPTPCNQNWHAFPQNATGGFCSQCSKTVIDFTQLTDKELYEALQDQHTKICGRFTQTQLNRAISYQAPYQTTKLNKILAGLIVLGTTQAEFPNEAKATNIEIVSNKGRADHKTKAQDKAQAQTHTDSTKFIEGRIVDDKLNPIAYASVYFKDKNIGVTTNNNGQFKLMVPNSYKRKLTIQVSAAGYEPKEMTFNKKQLPVKRELTMKLSEEFMGEVVIVRSDD